MEVITLNQPFVATSKGDGKKHIYLYYILPNGEKKGFINTTEKSKTEVKQAVVNKFLQQGYRAPQNEIAKYITQDGYYKKIKTGQHKFEGLYVTTEYDYDEEFVPGPKLVMTRGR